MRPPPGGTQVQSFLLRGTRQRGHGQGAPAHTVPGFEHQHRAAGRVQGPGRREARQAGTNDDDRQSRDRGEQRFFFQGHLFYVQRTLRLLW